MNTSNDPLAMWDNMRTLLRMYGVATMIGDAENRAAITALVAAAREATAEVMHTGSSSRAACDKLIAALANFPESK